MTIKFIIKGAVQGIGYRPFIAKKATEYGLRGYVKNIGAAVEILVAGEDKNLREFANLVKNEYPAGAFILDVEEIELADSLSDKYKDFKIIGSTSSELSKELPVFSPDIGICDDCLEEMLDKSDRRYKYPLISCASCGPRISIADRLPYDRENTVMIDFDMCPTCAKEYSEGRRRHAQTISCHDCGPQMMLHYKADDGSFIGKKEDDAVNTAIELLKSGKILGLKGISGYQLVCLPKEEPATRLRLIKGRENKPFAIMFSTIDSVREYAKVGDTEEKLLRSSARPIVLVRTIKAFPSEVCKESAYIGAFLPSSGIHRLLCDALGPLIFTSGNKSSEPMIVVDADFRNTFMESKGDNVDGFLYHGRRINMAQDDSVVFVLGEDNDESSVHFVRRARGYVPLPVKIFGVDNNMNFLALGGDLKSSFAFAKKDRIIPSQYIGDLDNFGCSVNFERYIERYGKLFDFRPDFIIRDMHPTYHSHRYADRIATAHGRLLPVFDVQHHHAHALSVMAENSLKSCIGVCFDGTGYGTDGKVWGGEFLLCKGTKFERKGHLSYVKLIGGDTAPKRASFVKKCYDESAGSPTFYAIESAAYKSNINAFMTSSAGRLFDAVSSLLGIRSYNSYEGECAVMLEKSASLYEGKEPFDISFDISKENDEYIADQIGLYKIIKDLLTENPDSVSKLAYSFHMALVKMIVDICIRVREDSGENKVCLSGGVFLNRILLGECMRSLKENSFEVYVNRLVPAGDGGISTGQAYYGMMLLDEERS